MPEDLLDAAVDLIETYSGKPWNGSKLYELLNSGSIHGVEFTEINFDEFSIRRGDATHALVQRENNRECDGCKAWLKLERSVGKGKGKGTGTGKMEGKQKK